MTVGLGGSLSTLQVDFFRRAGYLRSAVRATPDEIERMRAMLDAGLAEGKEPLKRNGRGRVVGVRDALSRGSAVFDFFTSPRLLDELESILGPNIEILLNRHNHATLNHRDEQPSRLHRDVLQWSRSVVSALVYLDDANEENGCTHVLPTSHFLPFVGTPNNGGTWMDEHSVYSSLIEQAVPVPMPVGSVLWFDSLTFHTVGVNRTDSPRRSVAVAYHSVDELDARRREHTVVIRGAAIYRGVAYTRPEDAS